MSHAAPLFGWKLDRAQRASLLARFPPRYPQPIADHVTMKTGDDREDSLPGDVQCQVVGHADDGDSLECLVVAINGSTDRPDGSTFHITWSLDRSKGREARESNDLLKERGWSRLSEPLPVCLHPARLR